MKNIFSFISYNKRVLLLLTAITFIGFYLRYNNLGVEGFWLDEAMSVKMSEGTFSETISAASVDVHPPLYYLSLNVWMKIGGKSEAYTRFLSLIFGTILIPIVFYTGRRFFEDKTGIIAAIITALSPFLIKYSQEARAYSLLAVLSTLSCYYFMSLIKTGGKRNTILYILFTTGMLYTHLYGAFVLAAQFVFLVIYAVKKRYDIKKVKSLILPVIISFVLYIPWIPVIISQMLRTKKGFWIAKPTLYNFGEAFFRFSGTSKSIETVFILGCFILIIFYFLYTFIKNKTIFYKSESFFLFIWIFTVIGAPFVFSQFVTPFYGIKYAISAAIPFYILAAKGISEISNKYFFTGVSSILAILLFRNIYFYYKLDHKEEWNKAFAYINNSLPKGSIVYVKGDEVFYNVVNYYNKRNDIDYLLFTDLNDKKELNGVVNATKYNKETYFLYRYKDNTNELMKVQNLAGKTIERRKFFEVSIYNLK